MFSLTFSNRTSNKASGYELVDKFGFQLSDMVFKLGVVALLVSLNAACVSSVSPRVKSDVKTNIPAAELVPNKRFQIDVGDELAVKFYYNPELSEDQLVVLPDGKISLQLVGAIEARGKTVDELAAELEQRYADITTRTEVTVLVRALRERSVFVGGEVRQPGQYVDKNGLNPLQAVFLAGGFKKNAELGSILVLRRTEDNGLGYYLYDLKNALSDIATFDDFRLKDSDIVFVAKNSVGSFNEFMESYVYGIFPDWFNVFLNYDINPQDIDLN